MPPSSQTSHYISLLTPSLLENTNSLIFRPQSAYLQWGSVTYDEFRRHIEISMNHWSRYMISSNVRAPAVVGLWLTGSKYEDLVNILGVSAAGYIPQLFSRVYSSTDVIWELLSRSNGQHLIFDSAYNSQVSASPIPRTTALTLEDIQKTRTSCPNNSKWLTLVSLPSVLDDDTAALFHSSGTTGGAPKVIPCTHGLLKNFMQYKYPGCLEQGSFETPSIINTLGSLCHVGSFQAFIGAAYSGACTVQSSTMEMTIEELLAMVNTCGLNRILQYSPYLSAHIQAARKDPELSSVLRGLRQIMFIGVTLNPRDHEWGLEHGLPLTESYGTSETAPLLTAVLGTSPSARLLRPLPNTHAYGILFNSTTSVSSRTRLYELVLPPSTPSSPHPSLFSSDGLYHTNDLFEQPQPGMFLYRGRAGDWIKTIPGFVDTKYIEAHILLACPDILHAAIIVGTHRPTSALLVESLSPNPTSEEQLHLAGLIVERMNDFNRHLFSWERVDDPKKIIVVGMGVLPRTKEKGNIRLAASEEIYAKEIDALFSGGLGQNIPHLVESGWFGNVWQWLTGVTRGL